MAEEQRQVTGAQNQQETTVSENTNNFSDGMECVNSGNGADSDCVVDKPEVYQSTTANCVDPTEEIAAAIGALTDDYESRLAMTLGAAAASSLLVILLLTYHILFRRQQRRQQAAWKRDNATISRNVDDLGQTVSKRDQEIQVLERRLLSLQESTGVAQEQAEQDLHRQLQAKQEQCDKLQAKLDDLRTKRQETDTRLAQVLDEINKYAEQQQDHDCQLLEQKLQASQLEQTITEKDARIEQLQQVQTAQANRIEELLKKAKVDAQKAETFIQTVSSERDDRFTVLQQENDAIKTTVMGLLRSTQESYDADKFLLKKEMRKRDDRIRALQDDLWKSNGLLKRLQQQTQQQAGVGTTNDAKLSASVSQYLSKNAAAADDDDDDFSKETKEDDHQLSRVHQKHNNHHAKRRQSHHDRSPHGAGCLRRRGTQA